MVERCTIETVGKWSNLVETIGGWSNLIETVGGWSNLIETVEGWSNLIETVGGWSNLIETVEGWSNLIETVGGWSNMVETVGGRSRLVNTQTFRCWLAQILLTIAPRRSFPVSMATDCKFRISNIECPTVVTYIHDGVVFTAVPYKRHRFVVVVRVRILFVVASLDDVNFFVGFRSISLLQSSMDVWMGMHDDVIGNSRLSVEHLQIRCSVEVT